LSIDKVDKFVALDSVNPTVGEFRMDYAETTIICDHVLKDVCKAAGVKGIMFRDAANY
jgi:hypothetical protein